jgi:hypothetical protein
VVLYAPRIFPRKSIDVGVDCECTTHKRKSNITHSTSLLFCAGSITTPSIIMVLFFLANNLKSPAYPGFSSCCFFIDCGPSLHLTDATYYCDFISDVGPSRTRRPIRRLLQSNVITASSRRSSPIRWHALREPLKKQG